MTSRGLVDPSDWSEEEFSTGLLRVRDGRSWRHSISSSHHEDTVRSWYPLEQTEFDLAVGCTGVRGETRPCSWNASVSFEVGGMKYWTMDELVDGTRVLNRDSSNL